MLSVNKKYFFVLVAIIILLPTSLFVMIELSTLQHNEKVLKQAYQEQLNAILFSLNQYTDDVLVSTSRELVYASQESENQLIAKLDNYNFVSDFFYANEYIIPENSPRVKYPDPAISEKLGWIFSENGQTLNRLRQFYQVGYQRLEPFHIEDTEMTLFVFIAEKKGQVQEAVMVVNSVAFIQESMNVQMQKVAGDQFNIAVLDEHGEVVLNSGREISEAFELTSPLQAFNKFSIGIVLKGETIEELVRKRMAKNTYFMGILGIVLFIVSWLFIRILIRQVELANLKSDFVSNVSHELRTPLSLINMYTETIEMGRVPSDKIRDEYIQIIRQEANKLSGMVNKILNFSQIDKKKKQYTLVKGDLNKVVEQTYNSYLAYFKNKGFTHKLELDRQVPTLIFDGQAIQELLSNLIDNAIKYSFDVRSIVIRTGRKSNRSYVEVEDRGVGILERDKKYIFDKFYRVNRDDVFFKVKGSGLGLSIVKHIVDAHKGKIEVNSKYGKGSTFRVLLPLYK